MFTLLGSSGDLITSTVEVANSWVGDYFNDTFLLAVGVFFGAVVLAMIIRRIISHK